MADEEALLNERIIVQEGLKVPRRQPKRGRLWRTTIPACGYALSMPIRSEVMTSWRTELKMDGPFGS
jgi:hypothetical protein